MEVITFVRRYESVQITLVEAFNMSMVAKSLISTFSPTEWVWDKRAWTIQLINLMHLQPQQESLNEFIVDANDGPNEAFGIEHGDAILQRIFPEDSGEADVMFPQYSGLGEAEVISTTIQKLRPLLKECAIHSWSKHALYEVLLRNCKTKHLQSAVTYLMEQEFTRHKTLQSQAAEELVAERNDMFGEQSDEK